MANNTMGNARAPRRQLADQLDRLDVILDGLADALNESVSDAVRGVVGQVVKEAVESTIKQVLGNPDLLRAALAHHTPEPIPAPKRSLKDVLKNCLSAVCQKTCDATSSAKKAAGGAWSWCMNKVRQGCCLVAAGTQSVVAGCKRVAKVAGGVLRFAWNFRKTTIVALTVGLV